MAAGRALIVVLQSLARARAEKGVTQEQIAACLGVSRQAVAAWEAGTAFPLVDRLFAWAAYLGFDLSLSVRAA